MQLNAAMHGFVTRPLRTWLEEISVSKQINRPLAWTFGIEAKPETSPRFGPRTGPNMGRTTAVLAACLLAQGAPCNAFAQEMPDSLAVYEGSCSVLIVKDLPSPKACLGSLVVNSFPSGKKVVLFHSADDEVIAFQAVPRQGIHFAVTGVEENGATDPATGTCTIDLTAQHTGEIRCEAHAAGHVTSGTFDVTTLKHVIGTP